MILSSLCEFYNKVLKERGDDVLLPDGYSEQTVHYQVCLTPDGEIETILSLATEPEKLEDGQSGKKSKAKVEYPKRIFPFRTQKPAIDVNIPEHRMKYLFGLKFSGKGLEVTSATEKAFNAFRAKTIEFFDDIDDPLIAAYCNFARKWNPSEQESNEHLINLGNKINNPCFEFVLSGASENRLQDNETLKELWDVAFQGNAIEGDDEKESDDAENKTDKVHQCSVYGENLPIARIHYKIKIDGGQGAGCSLVCAKNESENSYGKTQGFNCDVSYKEMKEYTVALNYLLQTDGYHIKIGDTTFVYFALADVGEEKSCQDLLNLFLSGDLDAFENQSSSNLELINETNGNLSAVFHKIKDGRYTGFDVSNLNSVEYCIFGLIPNEGRISVRYEYRNTFGKILDNVARYYEDFGEKGAPSFWQIARELDRPGTENRGAKIQPDIAKSLLGTMMEGGRFPQKILYSVINRIKVDRNPDNVYYVKFNDVRDGIVRACLNRNYIKNKEDKIGMALNAENKSPAYLCGRLFAVLEKMQKDSSGGNLDRTIMDAYFASAATKPATVFPRLLVLSQHHMAKLDEGAQVFYNKLLNGIFDNIGNSFPKTLTLEQQGEFVIGYRHQNSDLYKSKENKGDVQ